MENVFYAVNEIIRIWPNSLSFSKAVFIIILLTPIWLLGFILIFNILYKIFGLGRFLK